MKLARAVSALAICAACGDSTPVTLRYRPAAGASFRYAMSQDVTMRPEGADAGPEEQLSIRIAFTQTVKGPVDGGTEVSVRVDSVSMTSPQFPADQASQATRMLRGLESALVLDERMQVVRSSVSNAGGVPPQLAAQIVAGLRGASFPLPDAPVTRGESWSADMAAPIGQIPGVTDPVMLHYRIHVDDIRAVGADTIVHLDVETSFPKEAIQLRVDGVPATMRIDGSLRGAQQYSLRRSAIVRVSLAGKVRATTSGGTLGDGRMTLEQRMGLELLEDATSP